MEKFYDPTITVLDIEVWMNCSHRTAERIMRELKRDLNIAARVRPRRSVARRYLQLDK